MGVIMEGYGEKRKDKRGIGAKKYPGIGKWRESKGRDEEVKADT